MIYQFGDCILDTDREEVRQSGEVIRVEPQAFKVLLYLLENRERVVSRDELFDQCWPQSHVSDTTLTTCLRRVRQAIGQTRTGPTLIETVHRRGYHFVAEVVEVAAAEPPTRQPPPRETPALLPDPSESEGTVILVVDDDSNSRELLGRQLYRCGYATRTACDGQEALDQVAAEPPDLILLDVRMPVLDGFTVCRQLKADAATRSIPIIMLTALDQTQDRRAGLAAGAEAFLTKPVQRQALLACIEAALNPVGDASVSEPSSDPAGLTDTIPPLWRPPFSDVTEPSARTGSDSPDASAPAPLPPAPGLGAPILPETERRRISVLSCTLDGVSALSLNLDPEDYYDVMQAFHSSCLKVVTEHAGHVAQQFDDGMLVYFGYPQADETDVQRAVRSGLALVEAFSRVRLSEFGISGLDLSVRVGIDTGLVILPAASGPDAQKLLAVGRPLSLATQLASWAQPATVVVSEATAQLIQGYFNCKLLGNQPLTSEGESVVAYEVRGVSRLQTRLEVGAAHGLTPFVGREAEVALLSERWAHVQERIGQGVLIQGEAGIGKSRLVQVLKEQVAVDQPPVLECQCSPYYQNTALYPVINLVQRMIHHQAAVSNTEPLDGLEALLARSMSIEPEMVPLLADLLSLPVPGARSVPRQLTPLQQRERILDVLVTLFVSQAIDTPMLFVIEDIHWADPSTIEFLDLLLGQVTSLSLLVIMTCRPTFNPPWASRISLTQVALQRLTRTQMDNMIIQVAGGKRFTTEVTAQLAEKADGVPLFVEELTQMVLESGQVQEGDESYELKNEFTHLSIPTTLHDSLMARLDRLGAAKEIAQWGAVLGRDFSYDMLRAVSPFEETVLEHGLRQLVAAQLLFQHGLSPEVSYRFKHALIQDAAYESMLNRRRQQLHLQIAQVLETQFPETVNAEPERLAQHFTQAGSYEQAIGYWLRAGQRDVARSAYHEAIAYLHNGRDVLEQLPGTPDYALHELDLLTLLGESYIALKGQAAPEVEQVYQQALVLCQSLGDPVKQFIALRGLQSFYTMRGVLASAQEIGELLLQQAQQVGDPEYAMVASQFQGTTYFYRGNFTQARMYLEQVAKIHENHRTFFSSLSQADMRLRHLIFMSWVLWFQGYPDQALARSAEALDLARELSHPLSLTVAHFWSGCLLLYRREETNALEQLEHTIELAQDHQFAQWSVLGKISYWAIYAKRETGDQALEELQQELQSYRSLGAELLLPRLLYLLADVYKERNQPDAGLDIVQEAQRVMARTGERWWEASLCSLEGQLYLLRQGEVELASPARCFQQALDVARFQQAKTLELRAAVDLARLWQGEGQHVEACELLTPIYNQFTEGFDTVDLQEAQQLLSELS